MSDFSEALAALVREYVAGLGRNLVEIEQAVARASACGDLTLVLEARALAHRLHGTAGSYGLRGVSRAAGELEAALDAVREGASDAKCWTRVHESLAGLADAITQASGTG